MRYVVLLLFLLPLAAADEGHSGHSHEGQGGQNHTLPVLPGWVIDDEVVCDDHLVVGTNITIKAGGSLSLRGCTLSMDSPPYEDQYFAAKDEGLTILVHAGAELRMESLPNRPAAIERHDAAYGYTMKVAGLLVSDGLPSDPARITGLEGAYQGGLAFGGLQVRGTIFANHTDFLRNSGPSVFGTQDSIVEIRHAHVEGQGGIMTIRGQRMLLENITADVPASAVGISLTDDVVLRDCDVRSHWSTLRVTASTMRVTNCRIEANETALLLVNSHVTVEDSQVEYGQRGINVGYREKYAHREGSLRVLNTHFDARPDAGTAIAVAGHKLQVRDSTFAAVAEPTLNMTAASEIIIEDNVIAGIGHRIMIANPVDAVRLQGNTYDSVDPVEVVRTTHVVVYQGQKPLEGYAVELAGKQGVTDDQGVAVVTWTSWHGPDPGTDAGASVLLQVTNPTGAVFEQHIPVVAPLAQVSLGGDEGANPLGVFLIVSVGGVLLVLAWAYGPRLLSRMRD